MRVRIYWQSVLIALTLCLAGCGFTLRSTNDLPAPLQHLVIVSANTFSQAATELRQMCHSPSRSYDRKQYFQLHILSENFIVNSANTTLTYGAQYNTVTLTYALHYRVETPRAETLKNSEHTITVSTSFMISNNQMLGNQNMQTYYQRQLVHQALSLLLSQLTMVKIADPYENHTN